MFMGEQEIFDFTNLYGFILEVEVKTHVLWGLNIQEVNIQDRAGRRQLYTLVSS